MPKARDLRGRFFFSRFLRRNVNRIAVVNGMVVTAIFSVWIALQVGPLYLVNDEFSPQLHFGTLHKARVQPGIGRVFFRMNNDNDREYEIWLPPGMVDEWKQVFLQQEPLAVVSYPLIGQSALVVGLDASQWMIPANLLWDMLDRIKVWGFVGWLFFTSIFLWLLLEYLSFYRLMRWFRNEFPKKHSISESPE